MSSLVGLIVAILLSQAAPPAATGRIVGRVTMEGANTAIVGARIQLFPTGRPNAALGMMRPQGTITDQNGVFVFDGLAPGEYRLDVQKTGFAPFGPSGRSGTIQVAAGQVVDGVSVQLQKGGVITGRVLDPSGEPFTDARVMAMRRTNAPAGNAAPRYMPAPSQGSQQTNDLGEFRISGLAAGEYYVAVTRSAVTPFGGSAPTPASNGGQPTALTTTFYPGTTDPAGAQSVAVAAGAEVGNLVFTVQAAPVFRVSGLVVDEDGAPVARAMVILMGDPRNGNFAGPAGNTQTQEDGRFVIGDVPAGSYRIMATIPITLGNPGISGSVAGGTITTFSSGGGTRIEQPSEIVVADADVTGVRVVVRRPPQ